MSEEILRQPRTFWQWLTSQPGTLFVPPLPPLPPIPPVPRTAIQYLDDELQRIHEQLAALRDEGLAYFNGQTALNIVARLDRLHEELTRRSKEESTK